MSKNYISVTNKKHDWRITGKFIDNLESYLNFYELPIEIINKNTGCVKKDGRYFHLVDRWHKNHYGIRNLTGLFYIRWYGMNYWLVPVEYVPDHYCFNPDKPRRWTN